LKHHQISTSKIAVGPFPYLNYGIDIDEYPFQLSETLEYSESHEGLDYIK